MNAHLRANLWMLLLTMLGGAILYPLIVLIIGQVLFHDKAQGSLITNAKGEPIGSRLIAQPFTADEYFQPRPSSASYNGAASGATNWAANNYLLRDRVARQLGPIAKYRSGPKKGQLAAADIEAWFQKDQFDGKPGIVGQWAAAHSPIAQNWVKADKLNGEYVAEWQKAHPDQVAEWIKANPDTPEPKPEDLAGPFFEDLSKAHPGMFPSLVEHDAADGKKEKKVELVKEGTDIQSAFFDMWIQAHPDADLEQVPADMVMASGSGLDPDITLDNALYQLDRVAGACANKSGNGEESVRAEIKHLLISHTHEPLSGLAGVPLVNVLQMNLILKDRYPEAPKKDESPAKSPTETK